MIENTSAPNPPLRGEVNIIDVSAYVGKINFDLLSPYLTGEAEPRIHGVIIRFADGIFKDKYYLDYYHGFRAFDIPIGAYGVHYVKAKEADNVAQANRLIDTINSIKEYPSLGVFGDWERNPHMLGWLAVRKAITQYITRFENEFIEHSIGIYTNAWWDANVANKTTGASDLPVGRIPWFANYYTTKPYIPWDWRHRYLDDCWVFWQYDNRFKFPGIPGRVDMNTYNGGLDEFYKKYSWDGSQPGEDREMKYKVLIYSLRIRREPRTDAEVIGHRNINDIVTPIETIGDLKRPQSYWVRDRLGWSAAQYEGSIYMQPILD